MSFWDVDDVEIYFYPRSVVPNEAEWCRSEVGSESEKRRKELVLYNTKRTLGGDHPKVETRARGPKSGVRAGTHTQG